MTYAPIPLWCSITYWLSEMVKGEPFITHVDALLMFCARSSNVSKSVEEVLLHPMIYIYL